MFGLTPDIIRNVKEAFSKLSQIEKVILYGSRAKGNYKDGSDIDITLLGENLNLKTVYALEAAIDELYLPYTFDISIFTQIDNDDLIEHILSVGKVFYVKKNVTLPEGWEIKKLGDLAEIKGGKRIPKGYRLETELTSYPYIRVTDFNDNGSVDMNDLHYINEEVFSQIKKYTISSKDLYISIAGTIGKTGIIPKELDGSNLTENACKLVFKNEVDTKFIYYFTKSDAFLKQAGLNTRVAAMPKLALTRLKTISLLFPESLFEQKRIVTILDKAFATIANAKANAEQNLKNAKELFESFLQGVFENKGEGWEEKKWGDLCHFVRGPFGGSLKKSMFKEEGYVVYEQKHAIHNHFNKLRYFIDENKFNEMKRFEVKSGDIIMSCSGVTLGRVAVIPENIKKGIINQALLKLTPNKNISIHFLKHWLRSQIFQNIIFEHSGGAAIPNVPGVKILKEIIIPLPNIKEQDKMVRNIELILAETKKLEAIYQQKIEDLEELKKSVLQKAFNGELT